jgi:hypothetical protein
MKTKLTKRFSSLIAILAFLALLAGNAFAIENKSRVVSPYWQSDSGSYTFIAVSHTSLSGMASQIGLVVNALGSDNVEFGTALEFTIDAGTTTRVFLVNTNHPVINPTNIPTAKFIAGTTNFAHGHIRIDPKASDPSIRVEAAPTGNLGDGYQDVTMLSFWGSVVIEQNTTGFAMEFIGDMSDSQATSVLVDNPQVVGPAAP